MKTLKIYYHALMYNFNLKMERKFSVSYKLKTKYERKARYHHFKCNKY